MVYIIYIIINIYIYNISSYVAQINLNAFSQPSGRLR